MKSNRKITIFIIAAVIILTTSFLNASHEFKRDFIAKKSILRDSLKYFAILGKARNYFLFQSIGNSSRIVIGKFVVDAQMISLISVYCKDSEDTYIKEVVESLFKIISK